MRSLVEAAMEAREEEMRAADLAQDLETMRKNSHARTPEGRRERAEMDAAKRAAIAIRKWEADRARRDKGVNLAHQQYQRLQARQAREDADRREKRDREALAQQRRNEKCAEMLIRRGFGFVFDVEPKK